MKQRKGSSWGATWCSLARWGGSLATLALAACSGDAVDLGDGRLGGDDVLLAAAPSHAPGVDDDLIVAREALIPFAGAWQGYIEAYQFRSGSDRVRLTIDQQGAGKLILGEGALPAPPLSAAEPFDLGPAIFDPYPDVETGRMVYTELEIFPWEGFAYDVQWLAVEPERIRLSVDVNEVFAPACALQTPLAQTRVVADGAEYGCLPDTGADYITAQGCFIGGQLRGLSVARAGNPVSCSQQMLCREVCVCDAQSCSPRKDRSYRFTFDAGLRESGARLEGSLAQGVDPLSTVRLTRVVP